MSFDCNLAKEKVVNYMCKVLRHFSLSEFKDIVPEYFEVSLTSLEEEMQHKKLKINVQNLIQILLFHINKANWDVRDILTTAFDLELEHVIKHSKRFEWTVNKFVGDSTQEEISEFSDLIQTTIRNDKKDALVMVKKISNLFWISVIMKNLKKIGIYENPRYVVVSSDGKYFFTKDKASHSIAGYITTTLGYEKSKTIKLSGKCLPTLLKLLSRKENADLSNRPVYERGKAIENDCGIDFTQKESYLDFYNKCVDDTDLSLQHYTITSVSCPWLGSDTEVLRKMRFKSAITLSGDVAHIIKQMPIASIIKPPFPNYLSNYSVRGRNVISLKTQFHKSNDEVIQ